MIDSVRGTTELLSENDVDELPVLGGEPEEPVTGRGGRLQEDVPVPLTVDFQQHASETVFQRVQLHEEGF